MEQEASPPPSIHASQRRSGVGDQKSAGDSGNTQHSLLSTQH